MMISMATPATAIPLAVDVMIFLSAFLGLTLAAAAKARHTAMSRKAALASAPSHPARRG